jgi:uncharacterized membrane protein YozB (DUF420 family)
VGIEAEQGWRRWHAAALLALALLFAARVAAQLVQRIWPSPHLPAFDAWQSGLLPYWLLVAAQLAILAVLAHQIARIWRGSAARHRRAGAILLVLGALYMAGSLFRLAAGATFLSGDRFFSAWLPAMFHVVLASIVLILADYHFRVANRRGSGRG